MINRGFWFIVHQKYRCSSVAASQEALGWSLPRKFARSAGGAGKVAMNRSVPMPSIPFSAKKHACWYI